MRRARETDESGVYLLQLPDEIFLTILQFIATDPTLWFLQFTTHRLSRLYQRHFKPDQLRGFCTKIASLGYLGLLTEARAMKYPWDNQTCVQAAQGGHLEVLKWARQNDCLWHSRTCALATHGGHLEVLKWAQENGCI